MQLLFHEPAFAGAVAEGHVLQLAFAALVTDRAIQRMIGEQEFDGPFTRLAHCRRFGAHHHALGHWGGAGHLQLGRLLNFHQAHAAGGYRLQPIVIAKRRDLDANLLGRVDDQSPRRGFDGLAVDRKVNVAHRGSTKEALMQTRARLHARTDKDAHSNAPQNPLGISRQSRWSAWPPHPLTRKTFARAYSSRARRSREYRSSVRRRHGNAAAFFSTRLCLRGREYTNHNFRAHKTS